jgi:hypothetical protein
MNIRFLSSIAALEPSYIMISYRTLVFGTIAVLAAAAPAAPAYADSVAAIPGPVKTMDSVAAIPGPIKTQDSVAAIPGPVRTNSGVRINPVQPHPWFGGSFLDTLVQFEQMMLRITL